jgi:5-methylcytosine-specific restriction endonuclease McrA
MNAASYQQHIRNVVNRFKAYDTFGEFKAEDVFPYLAVYPEPTDREYVAEGRTYLVNMESLRYFVFQQSLSCVICGVQGTKFLLQRERKNTGRAHFNLYAELPSGLLLMTKDHIIPRIHGGKDILDNMQTMCDTCNAIKGKQQISNEEVLAQRQALEEACCPSDPS